MLLINTVSSIQIFNNRTNLCFLLFDPLFSHFDAILCWLWTDGLCGEKKLLSLIHYIGVSSCFLIYLAVCEA